MKNLIIFSLFALLNFSNLSYAQTVSLPNQTALPCENISFPITASNLPTNIGGVTLKIQIDISVLQFLSHTPGTLIGYGLSASSQGLITVAWSTEVGQNLNGVMLTLNFKSLGGACDLDFTNGCEIASGIVPFDIIDVTYIDGTIAPKPTTTYYVDAAVGASGNGLSWATALKKISEVTNKPLAPGDNVLIKPATYSDTMIIKTNGTEIVPLTFNVSVSDINKITFPSSADFSCVDVTNYPGKFYAYLGRSWKGNNGVYKIIEVNKTSKYVIVEGADFTSEASASADSLLLQASIGFPVVYAKSSANPLTERIVLNSSGFTGERATLHIGKPTSTGEFDVNAANYNIVDGIDVTGADQVGVRIQNSKFNVIKNSRIYELDSIGVLIAGNMAKPANNNYILNNSIYNTKLKAIKIGIQNQTSANNRANLNHIKGNEIYSSGAGANINFVNAIDVCRYTGYTVIEGNTVRNFKLKNSNRGAIEIKNDVRKLLAYANFIKNIDRVNPVNTHSIFYLQTNGNSNKVFNNVLVDSAAIANDVYAFWVNVSTGSYTLGLIGYNTVYKVDNGFKLESSGSNVDFQLKNNIMNLDQTAPDHFAISGTGLYNVSYNCYSTIPLGYAGETGRLVVADPLFLSPASYQSPYGFSLQSASLCLNSGNPISGIETDFGRETRSLTNPSRGAFENVISTASWTGEISTNWHDYRNWDIKLVPASNLEVIVPDRANDPVISGGNVTVKSLQLDPASRIRVNSSMVLTLTD